MLVLNDDNTLFGVAEGQLFHFDTVTWHVHVLATDAIQHLAKGNLYFIVTSHVYQYQGPVQPIAVEQLPAQHLRTLMQSSPPEIP